MITFRIVGFCGGKYTIDLDQQKLSDLCIYPTAEISHILTVRDTMQYITTILSEKLYTQPIGGEIQQLRLFCTYQFKNSVICLKTETAVDKEKGGEKDNEKNKHKGLVDLQKSEKV